MEKSTAKKNKSIYQITREELGLSRKQAADYMPGVPEYKLVKLENGTGGAAETKVVLGAGETKTVELAYSFAPDLIYFFIDSGWAEATAVHSGNITISGINFK